MGLEKLKSAKPPFVLLENSQQRARGALLFANPSREITATNISEVKSAFEEIEEALGSGHHVAGFMTYELGLALEQKLHSRLSAPAQLMWFGVFDEKTELITEEVDSWLDDNLTKTDPYHKLTPTLSFEEYEDRFNKVKSHIAAGDIYQLNLTFKSGISGIDNPYTLYERMRRSQPVAYSSLMMHNDGAILSASPELFIEINDGWIETRPMKGTLKRALMAGQDEDMRSWLRSDEKSKAENLMIVDLMRNDLARITEAGSVNVKNLFEVETYRSLHQMISTIRGKLQPSLTFYDIMSAIFPPGSITGAPKIKAMELIDELEGQPRSVYTGAIGYIAPNRDAVFSVAIRTIELDKSGDGKIGIGSGLVYDSDARSEYDECLLKMKFLDLKVPDFSLIETIGVTPERGLILIERHLQRLANSAEYFNFECPVDEIRSLLQQMANGSDQHLRIRLILNEGGTFSATPTVIKPISTQEHWIITHAREPIDSQNPFLYHKTTNREFYDEPRLLAQRKWNVDEIIFLNNEGEVTEGSITNIFIRDGDILKTPPIESGLLAGTLRAELLDTGAAEEQKLTLRDLAEADEIYVGNSVRGLIRAKYKAHP